MSILSVALYDLFGADDDELKVLRTGASSILNLAGNVLMGLYRYFPGTSLFCDMFLCSVRLTNHPTTDLSEIHVHVLFFRKKKEKIE